MDAKIVNESCYFDVRVAAIVVSDGKVLVQKKEEEFFLFAEDKS